MLNIIYVDVQKLPVQIQIEIVLNYCPKFRTLGSLRTRKIVKKNKYPQNEMQSQIQIPNPDTYRYNNYNKRVWLTIEI